jgi:outer membrane protein assembly factor BamE (lipoprotein component of BamABCDE complex)
MKKILTSVFVGVTLSVAITACTPIITHHGFNNIDSMRSWVKSNTILKSELLSRFGPPSFVDDDDSTMTSFYYIAFTKERFAFFKPEVTERRIIVVHFKGDAYQDYAEYTLEDGKEINIVSDKTPTFGKEMSVIQQILSNVGKFNNVPGQRGRSDGSVLGPIPGGI